MALGPVSRSSGVDKPDTIKSNDMYALTTSICTFLPVKDLNNRSNGKRVKILTLSRYVKNMLVDRNYFIVLNFT